MKKMRTFDIGNRKAKLFELFLKANKYVYVATEFDTFTRFYFEANDIDLMDATNFCEQYITSTLVLSRGFAKFFWRVSEYDTIIRKKRKSVFIIGASTNPASYCREKLHFYNFFAQKLLIIFRFWYIISICGYFFRTFSIDKEGTFFGRSATDNRT